MTDVVPPDVAGLIVAANAARGWHDASVPTVASDGADAARRLEERFGVSRTLAVYGTLAPGRSNHRVVAPLGGAWTAGEVEGELAPEGWGATLGYPAFRPRTGGAAVAVQLLIATALPAAWRELDDFEGPDYRRILVPVLHTDPSGERRLHTIANIYAAASPRPHHDDR